MKRPIQLSSPLISAAGMFLLVFSFSHVLAYPDATFDFVSTEYLDMDTDSPFDQYSIPVRLYNPTPVRSENITLAQTGLTFEKCRTGSDCNGSRYCVSIARGARGQLCSWQDTCVCLFSPYASDPPLKRCNSSAVCERGEICAHSFVNLRPVCVSKKAFRDFNYFQKAPKEPLPTLQPSGKGLTMDPCPFNSTCALDHKCYSTQNFLFTGLRPCQKNQQSCMCLSRGISSCLLHEDCDMYERCAETPFLGTKGSNLGMCASEEAGKIPGVRFLPESGNSTGLNMEACKVSLDCKGNCYCVYIGIGRKDLACSVHRPQPCGCVPMDEPFCDSGTDCDQGEVCAHTRLSTRAICIAKRIARRFKAIAVVK